jgi:hypothetical protein
MNATESAKALAKLKEELAWEIARDGRPYDGTLGLALKASAELQSQGVTPIQSPGLWQAALEYRESKRSMHKDVWGRLVFECEDDAYEHRKIRDRFLALEGLYETACENRLTLLPDNSPGPYYVSAVDGPKRQFLLGPYDTHQEALDNVTRGAYLADLNFPAQAPWCGYGTCRMKDGSKPKSLFGS